MSEPTNASAEADALDVGTRLREVRLGRRLTLRDVAKRAQISEGFLSQIELGRNSPSLKTFRRIADALGVDAADVLETTDVALPRLVQRNGGRPILVGPVSKFRVSPPGMTSLKVLKGTITAGGNAGEPYAHGDVEEVLIALEGTVTATVADNEYRLGPGDMLCYRSSMPHTVRNDTDQPVEIMWINSPPA
ncbi:MAG: XRE family transcriptional regulator [Bifidobacteriaceae bacterium]|jgi:DNA-binding XRE family transcriptional regulator|nr:XRE family transcriptional regulator [Bifidobacteriaceae bacterium]